MKFLEELKQRSGSLCELCESSGSLSVYSVPPAEAPTKDNSILICSDCSLQLNSYPLLEPNHWRCLSATMWSAVPAVQVTAWRLLSALSIKESWAQDLLDTMYLEEEQLQWAKAYRPEGSEAKDSKPTLDSNGTELHDGDTVTLIKDLDVKGAGFTAKRGTTVKNISLSDDIEQIEGRVNGVRIVLLTKFLKKLN